MPIILNNPPKRAQPLSDSERAKVSEEIKKRAVAEYGKVYTGDPFVYIQKPEWFD